MAKQTINLGTVAGDHTGTTLRAGGDMINDNFTELYNYLASGIYAYLTLPATTVITNTGDDYSYIEGTFSNDPIVNFALVSTPYVGIKYTGIPTGNFMFRLHATMTSPSTNTTVTIGIKKNGELDTASLMTVFAKYATETANLSTGSCVELKTNDIISLVITSDNFADITINKLVTSISPFIL